MIDFGLAADTLAIVAFAFLLAGLVKGVVGGGLPAVAVPIMAGFLEPALAAALTLVPVVATNVWLLFHGGLFAEVGRRYWPIYLTLAVGSAVGSQILVTAPPEAIALAIGSVVILLSPLPFIPARFAIPERTQRWLNPVAGAGMGVLGGATVMLAPVILYFVALRIDKNLFDVTKPRAIPGQSPQIAKDVLAESSTAMPKIDTGGQTIPRITPDKAIRTSDLLPEPGSSGDDE